MFSIFCCLALISCYKYYQLYNFSEHHYHEFRFTHFKSALALLGMNRNLFSKQVFLFTDSKMPLPFFSMYVESVMCKIPSISRALSNLSLSMLTCRVFNTQTASFSAARLFQAERFSSKRFGIKLL